MSANQRFTQVDAFTDRPFAGNPAAVCAHLGGEAVTVLRGELPH